MSVCSPCYDSGIYIDSCATGLSFWTVQPDTSYLVCIENKATKHVQTFPTVSNELGEILIEGIKIDPTQGYTLFVTDGGINGDQVNISINDIDYKCISFAIINSDATPSVVSLI